MPDMALASVQGSADTSANPVDAYVFETYRQVAETTRPTVTPRYARLAAFLTFVGVVTAALAILVAVQEDAGGPVVTQVWIALGVIGLLVSVVFSAQEVRASHVSGLESDRDAAAYATSSIYKACAGFFALVVVISAALLLVR